MDAYPPAYVVHNLPFIVLSGLGTQPDLEPRRAFHELLPGRAVSAVTSDIAQLASDRAQQLLDEFLSYDNTHTPWEAHGLDRRDTLAKFRMRAVGRNFQLPPKKADAPTTSETSPPGSPTIAAATSWILHSPISPLSPRAPVFPDGAMTPVWVAKHQDYIPSVFVSFFEFTTDPITNSLHDNHLKSEIIKVKEQIQRSGYKTRFAVVLLSDKSVLEAPDIDERLNNIRRNTGLDPKTQLFFLPPSSLVELRSFVANVLTTLKPISVEYYRDLTKRARRKKTRSTIPPPTAPPTRGTSQVLGYPGWGLRYEFKLGVFAEFRQEMDAAQRHYNIALDILFGPEGIFETTASWSPRWDEIRLLADTIALRHVRCQISNNYLTSAAQTWHKYKTKLKDVLDRRGKGTSNYGWEAWESTWAQTMAQLIQQADLRVFRITDPLPESELLPSVDMNPVYAPPEKQFPTGERIPPWELLHHAGYWYKSAAEHAKRRYLLARDMPEEDRTPPGMSPATKVSNRNQVYDHYLVPEPHLEFPLQGTSGGFEHWKDIVGKLNAAIDEFRARRQERKVHQLQLEAARTLLHVKEFDEAFKVLRPLWENMAWRKEGFWSLASEVVWGMHECALRVRDVETYIATEWELNSSVLTGKSKYKHDLMNCLAPLPRDTSAGNTVVNLDTENYISCLSSTFTFEKNEGNVGEPLTAQIAITSWARRGSTPITLSNVAFQFKGSLSEIQLSHVAGESASSSDSRLFDCSLEEQTSSTEKPRWAGNSDLTFHPGQTKVFSFLITFRDSGEVEVMSSKFDIETERFDLIVSTNDLPFNLSPKWWIPWGITIKPRKLQTGSGATVKVLPKPPKMEVRLPNVREHYYTDEPVTLAMEIWNREDEDTEAVLEVRLLGRSKDSLGYSWIRDVASPMKEVPPPIDNDDMDLPGHVVGRLAQGEKTIEKIRFTAPSDPADYALEVKVLYHLLSDRDIPISKIMIADIVFTSPFETSYELTPRVHPDPWPSYFSLSSAPGAPSDAFGIAQKWHLTAKIASYATESLELKDLAVETHAVHGGATCSVTRDFDSIPTADATMHPQALHAHSFTIDIRKTNLEERRPTAIDTSLNVLWRRAGPHADADVDPAPTVMTTIPIPRIQLPGGEPRVLASAAPSPSISSAIHLTYTLENPTMHFLTFELAMEASEEFGFSGAKLKTLQILPMSRQEVSYVVVPVKKEGAEGGWWITPNLRVTDRYFNKMLKVFGTDGMRMDKKGVGVWVQADEAGKVVAA
ncbi:hypothetical protein DPSP01_012760 [Paraphaeosphaeria sporulosa]